MSQQSYYSTQKQKLKRPGFHSIPLRTNRPVVTQTRNTTSGYVQKFRTMQHDALPDGKEYEQEREEEEQSRQVIPRSAYCYIGVDRQGRDLLEQGNKRVVIERAKRRAHPLLFAGFGALAMVLLATSFILFGQWWDNHQLDAAYGFPRTWQTDENVEHGKGTSHFLFENLNGHIFFEEIPDETDFAHARIYPVLTVYGNNAASYPVTATFADVNGDGKIDMQIQVGGQTIVFLNTGTGWKPEQ